MAYVNEVSANTRHFNINVTYDELAAIYAVLSCGILDGEVVSDIGLDDLVAEIEATNVLAHTEYVGCVSGFIERTDYGIPARIL